MERKDYGLHEAKLALGAEAEGDMTFKGYGAVFGNVDSYGDVILPGAFGETLSRANKTGTWPAMLMQHGGWGMGADDMTPIGVWTDLSEDDYGLKVAGKLADTPRGIEAYKLLKMTPRPAFNGMSIGYIAKEWEPRSRADEPRRKLKKIDLFEVSLVTFPANDRARVSGVKSGHLTEREIERMLTRDAQFTRSEARALMRGGLPALKAAMQDAGDEQGNDGRDSLRRLLQSITS